MKKTISMILSLALMLTLVLTASGALADDNVNKEGLPIVKEPITVRVMAPKSPLHGDFNEMWAVDKIEELTGIRLVFETVEEAGWLEKKNLVLASGEYPDMFLTHITLNDAMIYGPQGIFVPLSDYYDEYAPNLAEFYKNDPDAFKSLALDDGKIYMQSNPINNDWDNVRGPRNINVKWLENLGLEMPTNTDELYSVLKAFKEQDPNGNGEADELPFTFYYDAKNYGVGAFDPVLAAFGLVDYKHDLIDGQYVYVPLHENYRSYLEYMHKLMNEGLLDKEIFTQTTEQVQAKYRSKLVGFGISPHDTRIADLNEYVTEIDQIQPLTSPANDTPMWLQGQPVGTTNGFAITDKCENVEACIRLLDFFMTQEGTLIAKGGPLLGELEEKSGLEYEIDEEGNYHFTPYFDAEKWDSFYHFRTYNIPPLPFMNTNFQISITVLSDPMYRKMFDDVQNSMVPEVMRRGYPTLAFSEDAIDELTMLEVAANTYADQMMAKFITGDVDLNDETWADYLKTMDSMGAETIQKLRQEAYDNWKSK